MGTIGTIAIFLGSLATIVTSIALLYKKVLKPAWRALRRINAVMDVVVSLPERLNGIHSEVADLKCTVEKHVADDAAHLTIPYRGQ